MKLNALDKQEQTTTAVEAEFSQLDDQQQFQLDSQTVTIGDIEQKSKETSEVVKNSESKAQ